MSASDTPGERYDRAVIVGRCWKVAAVAALWAAAIYLGAHPHALAVTVLALCALALVRALHRKEPE